MRHILIALTAFAFSAAALAAGDAAQGQKKSQTCAACHGPDGNKTIDDQHPRLAGQYASYLAKALRDYKSGARKNAIMAGLVTTLSDQDIDDLSAFYAAQDSELEDLSHLK